MKTLSLLLAIVLSACATAGAPSPSPDKTSGGGSDRAGHSKANPYFACGARTSYLLVASVFRCPDGSNPFHGDLRAAAGSRRSNVGQHMPAPDGDFFNSHIVDLYSVPCATGPEEIYVCMYHCEDGKSPIGR
ncbi:MAG TPA: hypothetical protein VF524_02925 [Polyangia bacterium]